MAIKNKENSKKLKLQCFLGQYATFRDWVLISDPKIIFTKSGIVFIEPKGPENMNYFTVW